MPQHTADSCVVALVTHFQGLAEKIGMFSIAAQGTRVVVTLTEPAQEPHLFITPSAYYEWDKDMDVKSYYDHTAVKSNAADVVTDPVVDIADNGDLPKTAGYLLEVTIQRLTVDFGKLSDAVVGGCALAFASYLLSALLGNGDVQADESLQQGGAGGDVIAEYAKSIADGKSISLPQCETAWGRAAKYVTSIHALYIDYADELFIGDMIYTCANPPKYDMLAPAPATPAASALLSTSARPSSARPGSRPPIGKAPIGKAPWAAS
jgi:hypothetical protein